MMKEKVVIVTGSSGFLGSAITVDLARDHHVIAMDRSLPSRDLKEDAPGVTWEQLDISDAASVRAAFTRARSVAGRVDFVVHFAAFYHFGGNDRPEYEATNVQGTANIVNAAVAAGTRRLVFASSIGAMTPPTPGQVLTEKSQSSLLFPYARSKAAGEKIIQQAASNLPGLVFRIGGAFSDWCELPPLYSLLRRWTAPGLPGRLVPGRGESGFPYIHRDDVVGAVRRCLECQEKLDAFEVLLASQPGAVVHKELFRAIQAAVGNEERRQPLLVPLAMARLGVRLGCALGAICRKMPFERPWMLDYVDRPWVVDTSVTERKLNWRFSPGKGILDVLPAMLKHKRSNRRLWEERNQGRMNGRFEHWSPEERAAETNR